MSTYAINLGQSAQQSSSRDQTVGMFLDLCKATGTDTIFLQCDAEFRVIAQSACIHGCLPASRSYAHEIAHNRTIDI